MLIPIEGQPGLFKDTDTGQMINHRDFQPFEVTADLRRKRVSDVLRPRPGECWIVNRWSVLIHPWHEVIHPAITVDIVVNDWIKTEKMPLHRLAEPLERRQDSDLEARIAKIEERLGLQQPGRVEADPLRPLVDFGKQLINQNHEVCAKIDGPADELMMLFEHTKHFLLCLRGHRRAPLVRSPLEWL